MKKTEKRGRLSLLHSVRFEWFFSYLLVLAVPLLLCLLIYWVAFKTIENESEKTYGSSLGQIRIDFDSYLTEIQQIQSQLLVNNTIQGITRIEQKATPEQQIELVAAMKELNNIQLNYEDVENAFVVLSQPDAVISTGGYMSFDLFCDIYYPNATLTKEQLREYLTGQHSTGDMKLLKCADEASLLFPLTTISNSYGRNSGTIVITVNQKKLLDRLNQFRWDDRLVLSILCPDGQLICSTDERTVFPLPYSSLKEKSEFSYTTVQGKQNGILVRASDVTNWRYVLLAPISMLNQSARRIQIYAFAGLIACMLMGLGLSARLTNQHYGPLAKTLLRFQKEDKDEPQEKNEYHQLDTYLERFFEKRGTTEHELWNSQQALDQYRLYDMLERPFAADDERAKNFLGRVALSGPMFRVVLFRCHLPGQPGDADTVRENMLYYALSNIFQETVQEKMPIEMTQAGNYRAAILSLADYSVPESLQDDIFFTLQKMQELFHIVTEAAVGDAHPGLPGIHYSYLDAVETSDYCTEEDDIVFYAEVLDKRGGYAFTLDEERKLSDLVAAGSYDAAEKLIRQIYAANRKNVQSTAVGRCLAHDLLSALLRGANQAGVNGLSIVSFTEVERVPVQELENCLLTMLRALCDKIAAESVQDTPGSQLCEQIREYIQANYQNPDLNISQTGVYFNRTPAYLSSVFKKETGESLLRYINLVRLNAAQKLLETELPIASIAEQTGFRDGGYMIRLFKKEYGLTPGQYRNVHSNPTEKTV